jgi:putative cardiolipin synthase
LILVLLTLLSFAVFAAAAIRSVRRLKDERRGPPSHAIPPAPAATALDLALAPLTDAHPGATGVMLVDDNSDAFALRAFSAREAGRSLDLQYYLWHADETGGLLVREVLAAADRGVRVRVLLDDINARGKDRAILALDSHPMIEVRLFNPSRNREGIWLRAAEMLLRAVSLNRRMHNKAWIADGRLALVGGRNIGNEYFDAAEELNFHDADFLLAGPAVDEASAVFDRFWNSRAVIPIKALHAIRGRKLLPALRHRLEALAEHSRASPWLRHLSDADASVAAGRGRFAGALPLTWVTDVHVVSDPPEKAAPLENEQQADRWLVRLIAPRLSDARTEALLISPYFVPGEAGAELLAARAREGVSLRVLTNSLAATDVALVHAGYSRYREDLLAVGVQIHELKPHEVRRIGILGRSKASLHTKALVVDGQRGFVGSFNLDPRSVQLNTEMGVLFSDAALAGQLRGLFLQSAAAETSYRLYLEDGALRWVDDNPEGSQVWTREPEASAWRRAVVAVMRWLPIESQL